MICIKCGSKNVDPTCQHWKAGEESVWTGWYCYDCCHWWKKKEGGDME